MVDNARLRRMVADLAGSLDCGIRAASAARAPQGHWFPARVRL